MKQISSPNNQLVKYLYHLQNKKSFRQKEKKFLAEGKREVKFALEGGFKIEKIFFNPDILSFQGLKQYLGDKFNQVEVIALLDKAYAKIAYRETTEGILALGYQKEHRLANLKLSDNPLILVAENIEKPGNIGAMLRTADASNIDAFIIANPITDLYNPNIIRSSLGAVFTVQIAVGSTSEVINFLKNRKIDIYSATLQDSVPYYEQNFCKPTAIVVGNEANGLSNEFRKNSKKNILIPMEGKLDSLNVSVSAAVLIFEAKRQRRLVCG